MRNPAFATYQTVFGIAYLGLISNLLLIVACLPLVVLLLFTDPASSWPLIALALPQCAPALVGVFGAFRAHAEGSTTPVRDFLAAYRAGVRRAVGLGAVATGCLVVLFVDIRFFTEQRFGLAALPLLAVLILLVVATGLLALTAIAQDARMRLRDAVRAAAYLSLRRWYLTALSLTVLGLLLWLLTAAPAIALGLAASPSLYVVWTNSRHSLRALHEPAPQSA